MYLIPLPKIIEILDEEKERSNAVLSSSSCPSHLKAYACERVIVCCNLLESVIQYVTTEERNKALDASHQDPR